MRKSLVDRGHPKSRDYHLPSFPCRRSDCICNKGDKCISPACCMIGKDGTCEGYLPKTPEGIKPTKLSEKLVEEHRAAGITVNVLGD